MLVFILILEKLVDPEVNLVNTIEDEVIPEKLTDPINVWESREIPENVSIFK